jgi:hypothetical protein
VTIHTRPTDKTPKNRSARTLPLKNEGNRKAITITLGGEGSAYARVMYTINQDASGVILVCHDCPYTEHVNEFDDRLGSRRTQAAGAMLKHVRKEHAKAPIGNPKPQIMERWY